MKLRNKQTGEIVDFLTIDLIDCDEMEFTYLQASGHENSWSYNSLEKFNEEWEDYEPAEPLIKDEKIRKAVRAWAEAENCTREMNLYYTLNRQEKYITFHNPQTGSELQLCDFDSPVFQEMREYSIAELCGEEEE